MIGLRRNNMVNSRREAWRPPLFQPTQSSVARIGAAVRRFFDLQAASIWRDLQVLLAEVEGTVVDVGCGAQPYRGLLPAGVKYIGLDSADAAKEFGYSVPDTLYMEGPIWPLEAEAANCVLCTETLEHIPDPAALLNEARRCLAPRGLLILTVPFAARWHFIPYDYWRFTPSGLDLLLRQAGFDDIAVYARGNAFTVACYKNIALILRLAMPQSASGIAKAATRIASLPLLPLLPVLAAAAQLSLAGNGGDDCLGYTAAAAKAAR
jgi:SAM-dependent methyltransferase